MKPIECPDCHSNDWHLLRAAKEDRIREMMCVIREESDIQSDFTIVQAICNDCGKMFWMEEVQAECVIEEFM
jgi:hypothetical protein